MKEIDFWIEVLTTMNADKPITAWELWKIVQEVKTAMEEAGKK